MVTMDAVGEQSSQPVSALIAEAQRLYRRYAEEVIEGFGFCPWAADARRGGEVQTQVLLGAPDVGQVIAHMAELAKRERIAIGLVVFPEALLERVAFQHFAAALREEDRRVHGHGSPTWAVADFHPDAEPDLENADRMVAYIRRTPDPTLQLVRHSVLARVRRRQDGGTRFVDPHQVPLDALVGARSSENVPLHHLIAERNLEAIRERGVDEVEARLSAIHRDRHASYARLGLPRAPWGFPGSERDP